jgi:hypothetical protein
MQLPASVAVLGKVLDIQYVTNGEIRKTSFPDFALCSGPDRKTLWLWPFPKKRSARQPDQVKGAAKIRESWSELEADTVYEARPPLGKTVERLGTIKTIGYRSDKWTGTNRDYQHEYESAPVIYRSGNVFRIRGGSQRVTPRGIVG